MKKCMICGRLESDDLKPTCPACGEASWQMLQEVFSVELRGPATVAIEVVPPVKREAEKKPESSEPEMIAIVSEMNGDVVEVPFGNAKKRGPGRPRKLP